MNLELDASELAMLRELLVRANGNDSATKIRLGMLLAKVEVLAPEEKQEPNREQRRKQERK